jgi:hypothetical protein
MAFVAQYFREQFTYAHLIINYQNICHFLALVNSDLDHSRTVHSTCLCGAALSC